MSIGVFVSYNHSDLKIADALVQSLTSLSADLNVFIDHSGIEGGDDYEAKISASIARSQWFIIICSGTGKSDKDMSWCFYEAGQFRAKLQAADQVNLVRDRICYIYDVERPPQLSRYQGHKVSEYDRNRVLLNLRAEDDDLIYYENTEVFDLFSLILTKSLSEPLRNLNDANVRKLMRGGVRKLALAFADISDPNPIGEEVFQPRINFTVSQSEGGGLGSATPVFGEFNALQNIFGIASATTTWGDIRTGAASGTRGHIVPLWVRDLERAVADVVNGRLPTQTEFLCLGGDGKFYRPVMSRYELFKNNSKRCFIVFIPSRDRRFNLNSRTSLLISGLILSIRFRQRVLPSITDLAKGNLPEKKKAELLQKMTSDIVLVESEAVEFGLEPPKDEHEDPPLLNSFREGPNMEFMRVEIEEWSKARQAIFECIMEAQNPKKETSWTEAADLVLEKLGNLRTVNGMFINKLGEEILYSEKIE